jgi:hypothetical protein
MRIDTNNVVVKMTKNPFTPGLPIDPRQFVGRKEELRIFEQSLTQCSYGNPQHLAIMGERGIGKSSLLRKFESIVKAQNCLVVRRDVDASVNSLQALSYFILYALKEEGKEFFTTGKKTKTAVSDFFQKYRASISIEGCGGSLERAPPIAIQEEFYKELAAISKNIQKLVPTTVIMLDEAEHLQNIEGAWGFLRSVFTRLLENNHHYLIVISGKLGLFSNIKEIFSPMERFFFPREISLFNSEETIEAIEKPMAQNARIIADPIKRQLVEYTDGHPFIIQVFGYYLFESGKKRIDEEVFQQELPRIQERLEIQVFRDRFESASPKERLILKFMADSPEYIFRPSTVAQSLKMEKDQVRPLLKRLLEKDCLRKVGKAEYALFHKLFKYYIQNKSKSS